jgi:hypothetical protein
MGKINNFIERKNCCPFYTSKEGQLERFKSKTGYPLPNSGERLLKKVQRK